MASDFTGRPPRAVAGRGRRPGWVEVAELR
jgi:hypothetical protein